MISSNHSSRLLNSILEIIPKKIRGKAMNCRVYKIRYKHPSNKRIVLLVKCFEDYSNPKGHFVSLAMNLSKENESKVNSKRISVLSVPMKVHCSCPAWQYWGSAYNATVKKFVIPEKGRELRSPDIRDPEKKNLVCKHVIATTLALSSQSIYKALIGKEKSKHIDIQEQTCMLSQFDLEEVSVEECTNILSNYGYNVDNLSEDNFEEFLVALGLVSFNVEDSNA